MLNLLFVGLAIWAISYLKSYREEYGPSKFTTFCIAINWFSGLVNTFAVILDIAAYFNQ
jgi:hypothetical protein